MNKYFFIGLATLLIQSLPAHATSNANANLSNLQFTITDLDINDGIKSNLSWLESNNYILGSVRNQRDSNPQDLFYQRNNNTFLPLYDSAEMLTAFALAAVNGESHSDAGAIGAGYSQTPDSRYNFGSGFGANFVLTAKSQLVITMDASTEAKTTTGYDFASAGAFLVANTVSPGWGNGYQDYIRVNAGLGQSSYSARQLVLTLVNPFSNSVNVSVSAYVDGLGFTDISAVPEPETYAMLMAGLGLLGFCARRKKE